MGAVYYRLEDSDNAEKYLLQAFHMNPNRIDVNSNLSLFYYHEGRYKKGIEILNRVDISNQPKVAQLAHHLNLCSTYMGLHQNDQVRSYYRQVALALDNPDERMQLLYWFYMKMYVHNPQML